MDKPVIEGLNPDQMDTADLIVFGLLVSLENGIKRRIFVTSKELNRLNSNNGAAVHTLQLARAELEREQALLETMLHVIRNAISYARGDDSERQNDPVTKG